MMHTFISSESSALASLPFWDELQVTFAAETRELPSSISGSRCWRVPVEMAGQVTELFVKEIRRRDKIERSQVEPVTSKLMVYYGIPAPVVYGVYEDGSKAYVVSEFVDGRPLNEVGPQLTEQQRKSLGENLAMTLAKINQITPQPGTDFRRGLDEDARHLASSRFEWARTKGFLTDSQHKRAVDEFENTENHPMVLTHGDYCSANILVDIDNPSKIKAVVDSEHSKWAKSGREFPIATAFNPYLNLEAYREIMGWTEEVLHRQAVTHGLVRAIKLLEIGMEHYKPDLVAAAERFRDTFLGGDR